MRTSLGPDELLRRFFEQRPALEAYLMAVTRDYHLVEDVLQEVAVVVVRKAAQYDESRPIGPWVRAIARRELASRFRSRRGEASLLDPEVMEGLAATFEEAALAPDLASRREALVECMRRMAGTPRKVLELRYACRLSCGKVAHEVGKSVQSVYSTLKRAKEALRRCVEGALARGGGEGARG